MFAIIIRRREFRNYHVRFVEARNQGREKYNCKEAYLKKEKTLERGILNESYLRLLREEISRGNQSKSLRIAEKSVLI